MWLATLGKIFLDTSRGNA